jgi:thiamine pyrophosphate-dependent acetolactate synthase large subunit-like protein
MASSVADVIVSILKASGVRRVYGIPGDSLNGFTDALRRDQPTLRTGTEALVAAALAWLAPDGS